MVSLIIAAVIVAGTWSLFRESLHLLFDGVPAGIDLPQVRAALLALPGVQGLHDLHVWGMASSQAALTAHLVLSTTTRTRCCGRRHTRWRNASTFGTSRYNSSQRTAQAMVTVIR